ncbi:OCIA domain-containing protein 1 isoform X2 [Lutzomyia longipalpis]|uniref:OCIA domain-containing protein 1 isoform X2 n=1 Tax=Lutzomyia longipalpis TaxID=7200 RepID=UPI002483DE24|nr:OCIA domain-containing protein 1 isoform X2 [Lutzomyia longipalpis]
MANPGQQPYPATPGPGGFPDDQRHQRPRHPLANYHFSADELRVLKECNMESFYQRSLPLGTALGLAAYFGVKRGFLKPNSRWGAVPKVCLGVIVGYFAGKFSYQKKCAEKLMQLPNSKLAEVLKQRKRGGLYEGLTPDQGFGTGLALPPFGNTTTDSYSDEAYRQNRSSALNLDTDRPANAELDDIYRPNLDEAKPAPITKFEDNLPLDPPKSSTTYDELRQKNREEYMRKMRGGAPAEPSPPPLVERKPLPPREAAPDVSASGQKNKYGDVWSQ